MLNLNFLVLCVCLATTVRSATYSRVEQHAGSTFFDGWTYETGYDNTTNGDVTWSSSSSLAYVNSASQAIIKVDNTTTVAYNDKRNSVKLLSNNWYKPGTVFVMDALHVPVGCSVWPAWWTQGKDWPAGGEIDIFEAVNQKTSNQNALHTATGCIASSNSSLTTTGTAGTTNCSTSANANSGCTVTGGDAGDVFNANGGGVYIMAFELTGVTVWYYARANIPTAVSSSATTIDTSALGNPISSYSSSTCDISTYFSSQQMTLDITLCGDWAGSSSVLAETCPTLATDATCYTTYVLNSTAYDEAYFQINYLNIFGTSDSIDSSASSTTTSSATTSSSSSASSAVVGASTKSLATIVLGTIAAMTVLFVA